MHREVILLSKASTTRATTTITITTNTTMLVPTPQEPNYILAIVTPVGVTIAVTVIIVLIVVCFWKKRKTQKPKDTRCTGDDSEKVPMTDKIGDGGKRTENGASCLAMGQVD